LFEYPQGKNSAQEGIFKTAKMGKKNGKQPMTAHNDRAKGTSSLSQPAALSSGNVIAQFSSSGKLFAQLNIAVDADTLRVFESHSGQCVGRWSSSNAAQRVSAVEWVELPSSSTPSTENNNDKASRGKKRRKGQHNQEDSLVQDADKSITIEASTSNAAPLGASSTMEALALGLKDGSILILHPTQSTVIQILSHSSITSASVSLSFSPFSSSSSSSNTPALLWSSSAAGQISVWTLPRLSGIKGRLVAQYDTQCPSCTYLSVRYVSSSQPRINGHQEEGESSSTNSATTVQILLGQYSIKLFETSLPKITEGISVETVERPQIHLRSECSGHASEIIQLVWLAQDSSKTSDAENVRFLSIAKGDRFVSLWTTSISATSTAPASGLLTATLGLDEEPRRLAVTASESVICAVSSDAARIITVPSSLLISTSHSTPSESSGKHRKRKHSDVKTLKVVSTISPSQSAGPCVDAYLSRDAPSSIVVASGLLKPRLDAFVGSTYSKLALIHTY
jgi:U3 small nucleolar RNA-associated protein 5